MFDEEVKIISTIKSCKTMEQLNSCADWLMRIRRYHVQAYQELLTKQLNKVRKVFYETNKVQSTEEIKRPIYQIDCQHTH